jgi:hypothetical protein
VPIINPFRRMSVTAWTLLPLAVAFHAAVQGSTPPLQATSRFVLVSVTDSGGRPVVDVDLDDFVVREGGQPRDVLTIRLADYPIAIVLDNDGWVDRDSEAMRRAIRRFVERLGHRPVAIAATAPPRLVATFGEDRERALERVDKLRKGRSENGLLQAVSTVARHVQETGAPFSAIVVVTASYGGAFASEAVNRIIESGAIVHVVLQQKTSTRANQAPRQTGEGLMSLVDETHGQLTTIQSADLYEVALDKQARQLATELMVEYVVPAGAIKGARVQLGTRFADMKVSFWGVSR